MEFLRKIGHTLNEIVGWAIVVFALIVGWLAAVILFTAPVWIPTLIIVSIIALGIKCIVS
jgi:hypothetical protein